MEVQLDMYQTLAASVLVLMLGSYLKQQIHVLEKFCIPAPVVGGLLFAIVTCICYSSGFMEISFDDTLREVCMVFFFTSVGFQANLKVLKSGGKSLAIFLGLVILLIVLQNLLAIGTSHLLGIDALIGMCTGSIPMVIAVHGGMPMLARRRGRFNPEDVFADYLPSLTLWVDFMDRIF